MAEDPSNLSNLHDIVTPPDVSWWPLAPGWLLLLATATIALCYYAYRYIQNWRANTYRRDALRQLSTADSADQIAEILKRTALAVAPREQIALLNGDSWLDWLSEQTSTPPSDKIRRALTRSIYQPAEPDEDLSGLREFAESWIIQHPNPC